MLDLAERLTHDGVDVILDRWHLKPVHDKFAFMEQMVTDPAVKRVLVVCDRAYAEKADGRKGGVGTETQIISAEVYGEVSQEKFLPLVREFDGGKPCLPTFMAGRMYLAFADEDGFNDAYEALIRTLHDAPELKKPAVGRPPAHIFNRVTVVTTAGKFQRLRDAAEKGRPNVEPILRDYLENLADALEGMRIVAAPDGKPEPDEVVVERITRMRPYRDEFVEFAGLFAAHLDTDPAYTAVHDFLERLLQLHQPGEGISSYSEWWFEPHQFASYEWVLYLVATLLHHRRYKTAARFMDDSYQYRQPHRADLWTSGIDGFNHYPRVLEEYRKQRLKLNRYGIVADMVKEGATLPRLPFRKLYDADMLLFLRPLILKPDGHISWYPRLSAYSESAGAMDIFARATTSKGLTAVRELFGVRDAKELARRLLTTFKNQGLVQFLHSERFRLRGRGFESLVNWEELQRLIADA